MVVPLVLGLAACNLKTEPATNVTSTSATLHGDVIWTDKQRSLDWRWTWSKNGGSTWDRTVWHGVPPCPNDSCSAHVTKHVTGLTPDSHYIFRLVSRTSDGRVYGDSNGLGSHDPPYEYDSFDTRRAADGYPSLREIDYDGDFDPGGHLVGGPGGWQQNVVGTDYPGKASIVMNRVAQGRYAGKFTGTASGGGQSRAELAKYEGQPGAEWTYELLSYVPSTIGDMKVLTQHKQGGAGSSCYNGGLHIDRSVVPSQLEVIAVSACNSGDETETHYNLGDMIYGRWYATKVHIKFATNGFVEAWVDPDGTGPAPYQHRLPRTDVDTVSDSSLGVKLRIGLYGRPHQGASVWHDGFHLDCISSC